MPWAGSTEATVAITTLKLHGKKDTVKVQVQEVPNLPYTKLLMKERIQVIESEIIQFVDNWGVA